MDGWFSKSKESSTLSLATNKNLGTHDIHNFNHLRGKRLRVHEKKDGPMNGKHTPRSRENQFSFVGLDKNGNVEDVREVIEHVGSDSEHQENLDFSEQPLNASRITRISLVSIGQNYFEHSNGNSSSSVNPADTSFASTTRTSIISRKSAKSPYDHVTVTKVCKR